MSSNYTLTIKKLPKRRDCYSAKKKKRRDCEGQSKFTSGRHKENHIRI